MTVLSDASAVGNEAALTILKKTARFRITAIIHTLLLSIVMVEMYMKLMKECLGLPLRQSILVPSRSMEQLVNTMLYKTSTYLTDYSYDRI